MTMKIVSTGKIVIYTGNDGSPSTEYRAPNNGLQTYTINVNEITNGESVLAAWWAPYDNIKDLSSLNQIAVSPSGSEVALTVGAYDESPHRTRIMLYLLIL